MQPPDPTRTRTRLAAAGAVLASTAALAPAAPAAAATSGPSDAETHCVIEVIGQEESGAFIAAEPVCFGSLAEALASTGADVDASASLDAVDVTSPELSAALASSVLSYHYDGFYRTSSSITITGADCGGGYLNLSADWVDRISSTWNFCPVTRFFDGYDKSGGGEATSTSTVNLGALNNAAASIQYASS